MCYLGVDQAQAGCPRNTTHDLSGQTWLIIRLLTPAVEISNYSYDACVSPNNLSSAHQVVQLFTRIEVLESVVKQIHWTFQCWLDLHKSIQCTRLDLLYVHWIGQKEQAIGWEKHFRDTGLLSHRLKCSAAQKAKPSTLMTRLASRRVFFVA